jgi:hypothetical protein
VRGSLRATRLVTASHDPGGKIRRVLKNGVTGTARFGGINEEYRYRLTRVWDGTKAKVMFVLMNPSTADPTADDPTVAKCSKFARSWGYGGVLIANTFAYRATDQRRLREAEDPVGPDNDKHILAMAREAEIVVFAYGKPHYKELRSRGLEVAQLLMKEARITPYILRQCNDGTPEHPLYLPQALRPAVWTWR